jgi:uncharacterized metal-binding protein/predicted Fe-Mo cluster-binding NifX family protein
MRYGIQLRGKRVAPRYAAAETIRLVTIHRGHVSAQAEVPAVGQSWVDLFNLLAEHKVDALVCGGIDIVTRESLSAGGITVIDNVACAVDEVVAALAAGKLCSGYGFQAATALSPAEADRPPVLPDAGAPDPAGDCLACRDKVCLLGGGCPLAAHRQPGAAVNEVACMLDAAADISCEDERLLCRLSELVYFCLEMNYRRIGIAFCIELLEPTEILVGVLKRFFDVFAVGCKVGGRRLEEPPNMSGGREGAFSGIACNPLGQARVLNRLGCDLNVLVGLCMGTDAVFARASEAPATTLIVKDRSLAHNPIGALYSEYYLSEAVRAGPGKVRTPGVVNDYRPQ